MKKTHSQSGFTLLEMLLVLAVISLIAVSGLSAYQQKISNFKVEKTALQIQSLLEASLYYHLDHSTATVSWPSSNDDLKNYLPGSPLNNCPWYSSAAQCYTLIPPTAPATSFAVSVTIPTTQVNAHQLAQMIATRLPNAEVNDRQVIAYEPAPTPSPQPTSSMVTGIHPFISGQAINDLKTCTGGVHKLYLSLSGITNPGWDEGDPSQKLQWSVAAPFSGIYTQVGDHPKNYPTYGNAITINGTDTSYTPNIWTMDSSDASKEPYISQYSNGIAIETCEPAVPPEANIKKDGLAVQY